MVRISNPASSKVVFAAFKAFLWSIPLITLIWVTGVPDLWEEYGFGQQLEEGGLSQVDERLRFFDKLPGLTYKVFFYAILLFPFTFLYALKTVPKRLVFAEECITATFTFGEKSYPYDSIDDVSFIERQNGNPFLHLKIGKRKLNLEVNDGQIRELHKYIPTTPKPPKGKLLRSKELKLLTPESSKFQRHSENPNPREIATLVNELEWEEYTAIRIESFNQNWIECSGSHQDGFSLSYAYQGKSRVAENNPTSPTDFIPLLQAYSIDNPSWKSLYEWIS